MSTLNTLEQTLKRAGAPIKVVEVDSIPAVRIEANLELTARRLGEVCARLDLFLLNDDLIWFDRRRQRRVMNAQTFRGWIMSHCLTYRNNDGDSGQPKAFSLAPDEAAGILCSPSFRGAVREVTAINNVRLPVIRSSGALEWLPEGYDDESGIYTVPGTLSYDLDLPLDVALGWFQRWHGDFPFADDRSRAVQLLAELSLVVQWMLPTRALRPGLLWLANKPGSGKSVLAKASLYPVIGHAAAAKLKQKEELDKELEAFTRNQVPYIFLDNVYGGLHSAAIDALLTSTESMGRAMGGHGIFRCKNVAQLLVTGNQMTLNDDATRRFLIVDLFEPGIPAERKIQHLMLDETLGSDEWRGDALAAMAAVIRHWDKCGRPEGPSVLPTFEAFSKLLGGIVVAAGFEDPMQAALLPDAGNVERVEFDELMQHLGTTMRDTKTRTVTVNELAKLSRLHRLFFDKVGDTQQGRELQAKQFKLPMSEAEDEGIMTPAQRSSFGKRLRKECGSIFRVADGKLQFGERGNHRKGVYECSWR